MVGNKLKELRTNNGYTIAQLCSLVDMNPNTYAKYERDERDVSTDTLSKLADFYKVTTDYLLGRDGETVDPIEQLPISMQDKLIVQAYINLKPAERTELVEILKKIAAGAELSAVVDDGIEKTVYPHKHAARSGTPPSTGTITKAEVDEVRNRPDADSDL